MPPATVQLYIAIAVRPPDAAWAVVAIAGGDGDEDAQAALSFEEGGPVEMMPERWGDLRTAAIGHALRTAREQVPNAQLAIRTEPAIAAIAAGLGDLSERDYRRLQAVGGAYTTAGAQPHEGLPWSDRAHMIAKLCLPAQGSATHRTWGTGAQRWPALQIAKAPDPDTCSVCMDDFTDVLPSGAWTSRSPAGLFVCNHAVCRGCDWDIQNGMNPSCPLCRQPRAHRVRTRP